MLSACGSTGKIGTDTSPVPVLSPQASDSAARDGGAGGAGGTGQGTSTGPGGTRPGSGTAPSSAPAPATRPTAGSGGNPGPNPDNGGLGTMSRAFLRPAPYTSIVVELASATGAAPGTTVENNLSAVLQKYSGKSVRHSDHSFAGKGSGGCWNDQDIGQVAPQQRQTHTGNGAASLFMGFLDGKYCADANVLGLAYGASAVVIFTDQVKNLATPTVPASMFLESVTTHEVGHILGMVNIGYQSTIAHEDSAHPHHSSNSNSVMYYAIDQGNLIQSFVSGPPTTFDSSDEADLAGLRNGTL